jgi:metal-responsive CopG/Arc/MetJ family transcriptional regulator
MLKRMKRTTIFADEGLLDSLKRIAAKENTSLSATIRRALEEYVARQQDKRPLPSFVGIGESGRRDVAARAEELLWASADEDGDGA